MVAGLGAALGLAMHSMAEGFALSIPIGLALLLALYRSGCRKSDLRSGNTTGQEP